MSSLCQNKVKKSSTVTVTAIGLFAKRFLLIPRTHFAAFLIKKIDDIEVLHYFYVKFRK